MLLLSKSLHFHTRTVRKQSYRDGGWKGEERERRREGETDGQKTRKKKKRNELLTPKGIVVLKKKRNMSYSPTEICNK